MLTKKIKGILLTLRIRARNMRVSRWHILNAFLNASFSDGLRLCKDRHSSAKLGEKLTAMEASTSSKS